MYQYKLETGLEHESDVNTDEIEPIDIFDALDSIKQRAEE